MISAIRNVLIGGIALTALAGPTMASEVFLLGAGNDSCGQFLQAVDQEHQERPRHPKSGAMYTMRYASYGEYASGFLTGANVVSADNGRYSSLGKSDDNFVGSMAWLENDCRQNPLDAFIQSLLRLRAALEKRGR
jgi:hypothetical protein